MLALRADDVIVTGKYVIPWITADKLELLNNVKKRLIEVVEKRGYIVSGGVKSEIFLSLLLREPVSISDNTLEFWNVSHVIDGFHRARTSMKFKLTKIFRIASEDELFTKLYFRELETTRDSVPWMVKVRIILSNERTLLDVVVYPAVYYKIEQLHHKPKLDDFKYTALINECSEFIRDIMAELGVKELEEPRPVKYTLKKTILGKLRDYELNKIATLIENAERKLEKGFTEDALTDIRSAMEEFIEELIRRNGDKPKIGFKNNLQSLLSVSVKQGYFEPRMREFLEDIIYGGIYKYVSNEAVHKRRRPSLRDARFVLEMTIDVIDYMLDKMFQRV